MAEKNEKDLKNYYAGIGLVFGVIIAVNLTLIFEMDYWIVGVGAGQGLRAQLLNEDERHGPRAGHRPEEHRRAGGRDRLRDDGGGGDDVLDPASPRGRAGLRRTPVRATRPWSPTGPRRESARCVGRGADGSTPAPP